MANLTPLLLTEDEREALTTLVQVHMHLGLQFIKDANLEHIMDRLIALEVDPRNTRDLTLLDDPSTYKFKTVLGYRSDSKVPVIKLIREVFGLGLKEAKDRSEICTYNPSTGYHHVQFELGIQDLERMKAAVNRHAGINSDYPLGSLTLTFDTTPIP